MPDDLFLQILNMSFTGGIVILFVLAVRLPLKKAPKIYSYVLWSVVLFRLICPFSFESVLSLLPTKAAPISQGIVYMAQPEINTGISPLNNFVNAALPPATPYASANPLQIWVFIGCLIWCAGMALLFAYSMITLLKLKKRLRNSVHCKDNIYVSGGIDAAFVMGIFQPKIYLPLMLSEQEKEYILLHEQTHISRFDHVLKIISFLVLCVHWFNPLVWLAFFLSAKDMEMSCDEAVIKKLGNDVKKDYSSSLLTLAAGRRIIGGTPLTFSEGDTKGRIKNVLNYKKPSLWALVLAMVVVIVMGIGLLANPVTPREPVDLSDIEQMNIGAEMPSMLYADKQIAIMQGTFGLLVYTMDDSTIRDRISDNELRILGIFDGLNAQVSFKGDKVYMKNFNPATGEVQGFTRVYDVNSRRIRNFSGQPKQLFVRKFPERQRYQEYRTKFADFNTKLIGHDIVDLSDSFLYLRADTDWSMKSLELVRRSYTDGTGRSYRIFGVAGEVPIPVPPSSPQYSQVVTEEDLAQTEEIARDYFANQAPYYEGVVSIRVVPNEFEFYQNTGVEGEYTIGNIIIYKVLTERDQKDGNPERFISIARKTKSSAWEIINQGY